VDFIRTPESWPGWWQKLVLFREGLFPERHVVLIDLDVVILKSFDHLLTDIGSYELVFAQDLIDRLSSSFLIIDRASHLARDVVSRFEPERWVKPEDIDQDYLRQFIEPERYRIKGIAPRDHYSYKYLIDRDDWVRRTTNPHYRRERLEDLTMLNFHGVPKPDALEREPARWPHADRILEHWR
jgi:hypothetical protein